MVINIRPSVSSFAVSSSYIVYNNSDLSPSCSFNSFLFCSCLSHINLERLCNVVMSNALLLNRNEFWFSISKLSPPHLYLLCIAY